MGLSLRTFKPTAIENNETTTYSADGLRKFLEESGKMTPKLDNFLKNNPTLTNQQVKEILGNRFDAFAKWYDEVYLKRSQEEGFMTSPRTPAMTDMNVENILQSIPVRTTDAAKKRALEIGKQIKET